MAVKLVSLSPLDMYIKSNIGSPIYVYKGACDTCFHNTLHTNIRILAGSNFKGGLISQNQKFTYSSVLHSLRNNALEEYLDNWNFYNMYDNFFKSFFMKSIDREQKGNFKEPILVDT